MNEPDTTKVDPREYGRSDRSKGKTDTMTVRLDGSVRAEKILALIRSRIEALRPLVEEYDRLMQADAAIDRALTAAKRR